MKNQSASMKMFQTCHTMTGYLDMNKPKKLHNATLTNPNIKSVSETSYTTFPTKCLI